MRQDVDLMLVAEVKDAVGPLLIAPKADGRFLATVTAEPPILARKSLSIDGSFAGLALTVGHRVWSL
jgi:hypothetical protein